MNKPKISLVTCTYFRPDLLYRTIQSVQKQTFEDYEHIIVSDHCPFAEHVYNEFKQDKRIRFIKNTNEYIYNLGACSFNIGIEAARSDYISYVLDDDILYSNHLQAHYDGLLEDVEWFHTSYDNIEFKEPHNTVRNILSINFKEIYERALEIRKRDGALPRNYDVGSLCHKKSISLRWTPQEQLGSSWEDTAFMNKLGVNGKNSEYTSVKVNWGGIHRKKTKGLDQEYYDLLMNKLKEDKRCYANYKLIDQPFVFPELKNTLYEK